MTPPPRPVVQRGRLTLRPSSVVGGRVPVKARLDAGPQDWPSVQRSQYTRQGAGSTSLTEVQGDAIGLPQFAGERATAGALPAATRGPLPESRSPRPGGGGPARLASSIGRQTDLRGGSGCSTARSQDRGGSFAPSSGAGVSRSVTPPTGVAAEAVAVDSAAGPVVNFTNSARGGSGDEPSEGPFVHNAAGSVRSGAADGRQPSLPEDVYHGVCINGSGKRNAMSKPPVLADNVARCLGCGPEPSSGAGAVRGAPLPSDIVAAAVAASQAAGPAARFTDGAGGGNGKELGEGPFVHSAAGRVRSCPHRKPEDLCHWVRIDGGGKRDVLSQPQPVLVGSAAGRMGHSADFAMEAGAWLEATLARLEVELRSVSMPSGKEVFESMPSPQQQHHHQAQQQQQVLLQQMHQTKRLWEQWQSLRREPQHEERPPQRWEQEEAATAAFTAGCMAARDELRGIESPLQHNDSAVPAELQWPQEDAVSRLRGLALELPASDASDVESVSAAASSVQRLLRAASATARAAGPAP